jgi:two-component system phosphate regulon sensor histidine kinase PhoR
LLYFLPTAVLSSVGILILVFQRAGFDIVFGILVLILSVAILTGGVIIQSLLRAQARQVRLQTDFVAKVSHELRTPLASIRMFVDTLQTGVIDDEERALCLDVISSETSRLTRMIERLLSWGRMEAGRRTFGLHPELAKALVGEALAQLESQLRGRDIEVHLDLPEAAVAVLADRPAMVEALLNLMSNAIKYGTVDGHGVLTVGVKQLGRRVHFEIRDEGPGISAREQRRVFEKFYRGSSRLVEQTKGSGLGLAMVRHIVRAHRGRVRLRSQPGRGATFTVELPALPPHLSPLEVPADDQRSPSTTPDSARR